MTDNKIKIIRTVSVVSPLNKGKKEAILEFLVLYKGCVNYFIKRLWSEKKFQGRFLPPDYIERAKERFPLTARVIQCAGKEALQIVKSQRGRAKRKQRMPRFKRLSATLDSRFWEITDKKNSHEWIKVQSGFRFFLPFKRTKVWRKWEEKGFKLSSSIRLRIDKKKGDMLFIDFLFEKEKPKLREEGETTGLDQGYKDLVVMSDGQTIGENINEIIESFPKRRKHTHEHVKNTVFHELKRLDLSRVKVLVLEKLSNVKKNKRGMFSREFNRRLSHWLYAKVTRWLGQYCEGEGVRIFFVSPFKTSQYCRFCNKWDRRNRRGSRFRCVHCGHEEDGDGNAAKNLELLGLAGVYSLRSLQTLIPCNNCHV